ncbi:MAG: hypothetical protein AN482_06805 [Anabaena sp. LE011-02]|nr:MAG: hypothetical protein AN482_06805 [Anabaena sp. LE011-02]
MNNSVGKRLEQYTVKKSQEVLIVTVKIDGEPDQIAVFKGFSSSSMRPTAYDPDVPVLPDTATIIAIDRIASPYNPDSPRYLQQDISWGDMQVLLSKMGI